MNNIRIYLNISLTLKSATPSNKMHNTFAQSSEALNKLIVPQHVYKIAWNTSTSVFLPASTTNSGLPSIFVQHSKKLLTQGIRN